MCVSIFTIELALRFSVAPDKGKFVKNTLNAVDFIAIFPFYLELFESNAPIPGLEVLRILRLARVLRLFKVMKSFITVLAATVVSSSGPLYMLLFFVSILVVMSSSLLYYAERGIYDSELGFWKRKFGSMCPYVCLQADPYLGCDYKGQVVDVVYNYERGPFGEMCHNLYEQSPFDSIVATFWVILQTVTVVGYGDVMILTPLGMAVGTLAVASGILTVAMPISIINTNFNAELRQFKVKMLFKSMRVRMRRSIQRGDMCADDFTLNGTVFDEEKLAAKIAKAELKGGTGG